MSENDDQEPRGVMPLIREKLGVIIGVAGLIGWCAMLWFMFGDVL